MINIRESILEDARDIATIKISVWRSTYKDIIPTDFLMQMSSEAEVEAVLGLLSKGKDGIFSFVAENESGEVVGYVFGGPERSGNEIYKGEIYAIYILGEYQQQGVGRKLFQACVKKLAELKINSMLIWSFSANPSIGFYKKLGGREVEKKEFDFQGIKNELVAYGWIDISKLLG